MSDVVNAKCFIIVDDKRGCYGVGDTLVEALKNIRRESGIRTKADYIVIAFSCAKYELRIEPGAGFVYGWPPESVAMRFETIL